MKFFFSAGIQSILQKMDFGGSSQAPEDGKNDIPDVSTKCYYSFYYSIENFSEDFKEWLCTARFLSWYLEF